MKEKVTIIKERESTRIGEREDFREKRKNSLTLFIYLLATIRWSTNQRDTIHYVCGSHQHTFKRIVVRETHKRISFLTITHKWCIVPIDLNIDNRTKAHEELAKKSLSGFDDLICL